MKKTKVVECSLGCKTSEGMARRIDAVLPTIPNELRRLATKAATTTEVSGSERTDVSVITTSTPDRDREIVLASGIELDEYRANPIVLFSHNQDIPCGRCLWIKPTESGLTAKSHYPQRPAEYVGEWNPDYVFSLILAEVLKGKSIGFLPLEIRDPEIEELQLYPDLERVITRSLLVEYSVVSCPSNPRALIEAINKGITTQERWGIETIGRVKEKKVKPVLQKAA